MRESSGERPWAGRRVFVLGGGPSLKSVDLSPLSDETTLGLNMAFLHNPTATLVYDLRCMEMVSRMPEWAAYRGVKFWLNSEARSERAAGFPGTRILAEHRSAPQYPRWPSTLGEGVYRGNNAGSAGVCLADILGADMIYLLGFDMRAEAGMPQNWHEIYPKEWRASEAQLATYRADLARVAGMVRAKVMNLTPGSALKCFKHAAMDDVLAAGRRR